MYLKTNTFTQTFLMFFFFFFFFVVLLTSTHYIRFHKGKRYEKAFLAEKSTLSRAISLLAHAKSGPEVIKLFSCSTHLSMKFILF